MYIEKKMIEKIVNNPDKQFFYGKELSINAKRYLRKFMYHGTLIINIRAPYIINNPKEEYPLLTNDVIEQYYDVIVYANIKYYRLKNKYSDFELRPKIPLEIVTNKYNRSDVIKYLNIYVQKKEEEINNYYSLIYQYKNKTK